MSTAETYGSKILNFAIYTNYASQEDIGETNWSTNMDLKTCTPGPAMCVQGKQMYSTLSTGVSFVY